MPKRNMQKKSKELKIWPLYVILIALFITYVFSQRYQAFAIITGTGTFFVLLIIIVLEFMNGVKEEGYAKNIVEIVGAVILVLIGWLAIGFVLHTPTPINVVPSCSMLPYLHRGDMIAIRGITNINQLKAPIVNMSSSQFNSMYSDASEEFLSCVAYNRTPNGIMVSQYFKPGWSIGLYSGRLNTIISQSEQVGPVRYTCGLRDIEFQNGTIMQEAYTTSISIDNHTIKGDMNNSVVVYKTIPQDSFYQYGDAYVVHRVYAIINASGNYYALTKGDNNPGLDMQYGNYPISMNDIEGEVIASVPYLGYLKLILSNSFSRPAGCNFVTEH
ncbi:MAG: hypothetical protein ACP5MX_00550 [Candidatus Micrarchaeia archaeon]